MKFFRILFFGLVILLLISPLFYWSSGLGQNAADLSTALIRHEDGSLSNSPKAEALHTLLRPMRIQRILLPPLLFLTFQLTGGAVAFRKWLDTKFDGNVLKLAFLDRWLGENFGITLLVIVSFVTLFDLSWFLLNLPLAFYRSFILAHQFGLSAHTVGSWFSDWGKNVTIALLTDLVIWGGLFVLIRQMPRRWPVIGGAILAVLAIGFTLFAPLIITPLFFEIQPLEEPDLNERIVALAERAQMPVDGVFVINASSKTTQVNAYVAGFGDLQRMMLYDTLITGYSSDEIEVVLAHELGHWYYRHLLWGTLGVIAGGWIGLFALRWLINRSWGRLNLTGPADVAGLPYLMAVVSIVTTLSLPFQNGISRYAERQADEFALTVSQKPAEFISLFEGLSEQNLSSVNPPYWEKIIFATHPPTSERVQRAKQFQSR